MTFTLMLVVAFLAVSILFYVLFAGADFGAGILELFLGRERRADQRALISRAMAPVWEANHIWLVLAVVILFMAFPVVYNSITVYLHLPLMAILVGIVFRGCAFTFRHYDPPSPRLQHVYSLLFSLSSLWTAFFLGALAGACVLGQIDPAASDFYGLYIAPWLNWFCAAMGLFTASLFALLAAIFLVGESEDYELRRLFRRKARRAAILLVAIGPVVFATAHLEGLPLATDFVLNPISMACFLLATLLLYPFWRSLARDGRTLTARVLGAAIVSLVIFGWYAVQFPVVLAIASPGDDISLSEAAAPDATLRALRNALLVGIAIILPALGYLFTVFKWDTLEEERSR